MRFANLSNLIPGRNGFAPVGDAHFDDEGKAQVRGGRPDAHCHKFWSEFFHDARLHDLLAREAKDTMHPAKEIRQIDAAHLQIALLPRFPETLVLRLFQSRQI